MITNMYYQIFNFGSQLYQLQACTNKNRITNIYTYHIYI